MSGYSLGRNVEYMVTAHLRDNGYEITRAASSKGTADVIGIKTGQVLLVSVKRSRMPGPAERAELVRVADLLPGVGVPLVAIGNTTDRTNSLEFRRLTGVGPRDWMTWVADEVTA